MASLTDYRGLQVLDPAPVASGGDAIQDNFKHLVDWQPKSVYSETSDPTPSDDVTDSFYPGSVWLRADVTPPKLFVCVDSTTGAAVWKPILLAIAQDSSPALGGNLNVSGQQIVTTSNGHLPLMPNGTGGVGVGTTTPIAKLQVAANSVVNGNFRAGTAGTPSFVGHFSASKPAASTHLLAEKTPTTAGPLTEVIARSADLGRSRLCSDTSR